MTAQAATHAPEYVRRIARYVGGKPIEELAREVGLDPTTIVKLASNENPRGPSPKALAAIAQAATELTRYPDGNAYALKSVLAERLDVPIEGIVLGNGSNDVLELVTHAFLRAGDEAVYARHAFVVYPLATQARGATGIEVPMRDYAHDLEAMHKAITPLTRVVFVANPNNPTGTWLPPEQLEAFVRSVPRDTLVVLDEAYNEYLEPQQDANSTAWVARYPNLIVTRSFSKAYGLAALRIGYGVMDPEVADLLNRVRQPFNVNALAQAAALAALADTDYVRESRALNFKGMRQLEQGLRELNVAYIASHGNFILARVGHGMRVYGRLLDQGVIVRPVANYALPEWLRITVGLPSENERFLGALRIALHD
ncbi:MAG TPA: histidinol-phosphate transaminase [Casimicrobiaceae bacterium]|nr:histidinol-phosphate transaminase [Casimicrobiaceae bacterium]